VQNHTNEFDAQGEDDLGRENRSIVFRLHLKVSMVGDKRISMGVEFQMTGAAERKEREPKLLLDGLETRKCWTKGTG